MSVWPQKIEIDDNSSNEQESEFLRLPNEVLSMIFELIPVRFELAAVCRKFYEILIYLERFSFVLSVHCEDTVSLSVLKKALSFKLFFLALRFRHVQFNFKLQPLP